MNRLYWFWCWFVGHDYDTQPVIIGDDEDEVPWRCLRCGANGKVKVE